MIRFRRPHIAREARSLLLPTLAGAGIVHYAAGPVLAAPLWAAALALIFVFRDPEREVPPAPLGVVSPVDGRVVAAGGAYDPYLERAALRVAIRMRPLGPYVMRSPIEGKISNLWPPGAADGGARAGRLAIGIQTDEGEDVVVALAARRGGLRPTCHARIGERMGQGQRCGMACFGGEVEVFVPENSRLEVQEAAPLLAGSDIIATLVHKKV